MKQVFKRHDLAVVLCSRLGLRQVDANAALDIVFGEITAALAEGRRCEFRRFGTFTVGQRKAHIGRNPHKPEQTYRIPGRTVVKFHAAGGLRKLVSGVKA